LKLPLIHVKGGTVECCMTDKIRWGVLGNATVA
jgi:hypothetical protein